MSRKVEDQLKALPVFKAVGEIIADRIEEVIKHHENPATSRNPSKIVVEVTMKPTRPGQFETIITGSTKPASTEPFTSTLYASTKDGEVTLSQFDPRQTAMDLTEGSHDDR